MSSGAPDRPTDEATVDHIVRSTLAVDGVAGLHGGAAHGGVQLVDDGVTVHLVVGYGAPLHRVADAVRGVVAPLVTGPVDVIIEDVSTPGSET